MILDTWCESWPDELKNAQRDLQRAYYRVVNLEARVKFADDFDGVMDELEIAQDDFRTMIRISNALYMRYCAEQFTY
jgi:hypothetical protein